MFDDINQIRSGGVLPTQWLRKAANDNVILSERFKIPEANYQPASLDLRLGERAHRLRCSFLPDASTVLSKLRSLAMGEIDLRDGAILERNQPYLIPLIEELHLPEGIRAKTNPKSSTGRLDIFTRVITDNSHRFDEIRAGYSGQLFLEVVSRSFTIKVRSELSLNQIRLIKGKSELEPGSLREAHHNEPVVFPQPGRSNVPEPEDNNTITLSANLAGEREGVGFRAKKNSSLLDLSREFHYDPGDYWDPVRTDRTRSLILEPEEFYLLTSAETVRIQPNYAAEMTPYDPSSGELRTHYAGFFDPGFGYNPQGNLADGQPVMPGLEYDPQESLSGGQPAIPGLEYDPQEGLAGSQPVMEVRAHDVPFMIEHGQKICTLTFERMLEIPEKTYGEGIGSSYQGKGLVLSKHFLPNTDHR